MIPPTSRMTRRRLSPLARSGGAPRGRRCALTACGALDTRRSSRMASWVSRPRGPALTGARASLWRSAPPPLPPVLTGHVSSLPPVLTGHVSSLPPVLTGHVSSLPPVLTGRVTSLPSSALQSAPGASQGGQRRSRRVGGAAGDAGAEGRAAGRGRSGRGACGSRAPPASESVARGDAAHRRRLTPRARLARLERARARRGGQRRRGRAPQPVPPQPAACAPPRST
jgi:hypothetical protein